jgi:RNA polymerase sigma factor (sigma-70 family)
MGPAKDLAQESFLRAYLCLKHLWKPESFKSWLHGIALNVHRDYLREKDASHASFEAVTGGCSVDAFLPSGRILDPQEMAERTELRQIVLKAVNSLSPNLRQPVFYFYYEKMGLEEIALRMGLSGSAVKSRLHRGRLFLREILYRLFIQYSFEHYLKTWRKKMIKASVFDVVTFAEDSMERIAVLLIVEEQKKIVPIYIDKPQAIAIALGVKGKEFPRPMTYELVASLLEAADVKVKEVHVESLKDSTFYGVVKIEANGKEKDVDARPSDAIALALRAESPIYVAEDVLNRAGIAVSVKDLKKKPALKGIKDTMNTIEEYAFEQGKMMDLKIQSLLTKDQVDI